MAETETEPREPVLRAVAMPADTNARGDIFGGWIMAQMDLAAGIVAMERAQGRAATVAVDGLTFHRPVRVGDVVSCYGAIIRCGRTSITVRIQAWVRRYADTSVEKVTEATFVYVAIDEAGRPRAVPEASDAV